MKPTAFLLSCFLAFLTAACGSEPQDTSINPPLPEGPKSCFGTPSAAESPLSLKIYLDPETRLNEKFVLESLNRYWREAGLKIEKADTPDKADFGLVYMRSICSWPIGVGRLQYKFWANLDSIIVDHNCFDQIGDYYKKFPSAVSHALGNLLGIEGYPEFCSQGVMNNRVLSMGEPDLPSCLSLGDKTAYHYRTKFVKERKEVCFDESAKWHCGEFETTETGKNRFWIDAEFADIPVGRYLNDFYRLFGRQFTETNRNEAEFVIEKWSESYTNCSPLAITYSSKKQILVKPGNCLTTSEPSNWAANIFTHEVGHLFGMEHIPEWCGRAIMNPRASDLTGYCFSQKDVLAWIFRNKKESVLGQQIRPPDSLYLKENTAVKLSRLRTEFDFRRRLKN